MLQDLLLAVRTLRSQPGFTLTAVATLTLTIGSNTAVLSIADAVLFRPLPYPDPGRLFVIRKADGRTGNVTSGVPYTYVRAVQDSHAGLGSVGLRGTVTMMEHGHDDAEYVETTAVTPEYLRILGVTPARGRLFEEADAADPGRVVLLSHSAWKTRFGGDESIVGRSVRFGSRAREAIGVLPQNFLFPSQALRFRDRLTGIPEFVTVRPTPGANADRKALAGIVFGNTTIDPVVRLERGVTRAQAQAELDALVLSLGPPPGQSTAPKLVLDNPRALLFPTGRGVLGLLLAAAGLVLLIGCANLTHLLLTRARRREQEIAVRVALGASRARILRPIVFEALLVAGAGALLAVAATALTFDALLRHVPAAAYGHAVVGVDTRVGAQSMMLGAVAGVLCVLVPVVKLAGLYRRPFTGVAGERIARGIFERSAVFVQVAIAVILLTGALVAARALTSVLGMPLGFDPRDIIALEVDPPQDRLRRRAFYVNAIQSLAERADVAAVGAAGSTPLDRYMPDEALLSHDGSELPMVVHVLPGYFETAGIAVRRGRLPAWEDLMTGAAIAVVSESAAALLFPGDEAIGKTIRTARGRVLTVTGVVSDVLMSLDRDFPPPVYVIPDEDTRLTLLVRVRARQQGAHEDIRKQVARLAPGKPVLARWWSNSIDALTPYRTPRFQTLVLGSFAALAIGLTGMGLFAIVQYVVSARTREMGIRIATGASPRSVTALIIRETAWPVSAGLVAGVFALYALRRIAEAHLVGLDAHAPMAVAASVAIVGTAAVLAAWVPARKAGRVDPAIVLRAD